MQRAGTGRSDRVDENEWELSEAIRARAAGPTRCASFEAMRIATGKVVGGRLEIDGEPLVEGATVTILVPEERETFELTPEEAAELEASLREIERGDAIDGATLVRELRR